MRSTIWLIFAQCVNDVALMWQLDLEKNKKTRGAGLEDFEQRESSSPIFYYLCGDREKRVVRMTCGSTWAHHFLLFVCAADMWVPRVFLIFCGSNCHVRATSMTHWAKT